MIQFRATTVASLIALSASPLFAITAEAADKVVLQIDGAAAPFYAPLYAGVEKGIFEKNGIEVEFIYAAAADILTNIAAGNVDFGFPNGDAVIAAAANGLPVKVVHTTYQRGIGALLAKESSGIKSYKDLKGKKIAVTSLASPNYLQLQVGLQQAGLKLDDVSVEVVATGAIIPALKAEQVDAIVFSELRKYNLEADGTKVTMILSNGFLPSFGNVVVTSDKKLAQNADVVKRFTTAVTQSYQWVIDGHTSEALDITFSKYTPTWPKDQKGILTTAFEQTFIPSVWQSPLTQQKGLGAADMGGWQKSADILAQYKVIDSAPKAADFVVDPSTIGQ
ncbi:MULTISPECIES: ABC transporter substrate-binding protein [Rhizobium]|jgi:NitT/TauT family transport system substrate-binding protein|uniref:NitT/TauT family transport system substrate-binding protein n=1 Tax=Rhizobium lusitanum TaxID=293958 RepID=A0A1C3XHE5_9HYPH|nr:ABC transporter substrate-binding protein [Rhizobium lusitanum]SCB51673.1 NitT/TauT family transport system substrate-binding protein [Rhizobium lusitanum]